MRFRDPGPQGSARYRGAGPGRGSQRCCTGTQHLLKGVAPGGRPRPQRSAATVAASHRADAGKRTFQRFGKNARTAGGWCGHAPTLLPRPTSTQLARPVSVGFVRRSRLRCIWSLRTGAPFTRATWSSPGGRTVRRRRTCCGGHAAPNRDGGRPSIAPLAGIDIDRTTTSTFPTANGSRSRSHTRCFHVIPRKNVEVSLCALPPRS